MIVVAGLLLKVAHMTLGEKDRTLHSEFLADLHRRRPTPPTAACTSFLQADEVISW